MIYRTMLKSKIHRATVTDANLDYEGSITIDRRILEAADILEHEKVQVLNLSNGNRLETYVIEGAEGSGQVCINGAAARLVAKGDKVIIVSYAGVENDQAASFPSKVVLVDEVNRICAVNRSEPLRGSC
jgi:aspartate 1-decarboxylase